MGLLGMLRYGFFVGLPESNEIQAEIEKEGKTYGDVIQVDVSYSYIDPVNMADLLNWLNNNCANVDFVFKMNDYMFLYVRNLAQFVRSNYKSVKTLFGDQSPLLQPPKSGRWAHSETAWPWSTNPRHVFRHAFFMYGASILPLLAAFQTVPTIPLYYVYVTGMCTEKATDVHGDKIDTQREVEEYYKHFSQCKVVDSKGTLKNVDPNDPVRFFFE